MTNVLFYICGVPTIIAIIITVIISYAVCVMSGRISTSGERYDQNNSA